MTRLTLALDAFDFRRQWVRVDGDRYAGFTRHVVIESWRDPRGIYVQAIGGTRESPVVLAEVSIPTMEPIRIRYAPPGPTCAWRPLRPRADGTRPRCDEPADWSVPVFSHGWALCVIHAERIFHRHPGKRFVAERITEPKDTHG